jgi:hypothetical protein
MAKKHGKSAPVMRNGGSNRDESPSYAMRHPANRVVSRGKLRKPQRESQTVVGARRGSFTVGHADVIQSDEIVGCSHQRER